MKKIISIAAAALLMVCAVSSHVSAVAISTKEYLDGTVDYTVNTLFSELSPQYGDEWYIIALARSGDSLADGVLNAYYESVEDDIKAKGGIYDDGHGKESLGEYVRVMMALTAMGEDVTDFGGYNLCEKIDSLDFLDYQNSSTSTLSYALIMTDFYSDKIEDSDTLKEDIIDEIMTRYIDETGFTYMLGEYAAVDTDSTAQAIQGLSLCADDSDASVNTAIKNSYAYLKSQQGEDGAIMSWGSANPSSTAQALISATMLTGDDYAEFTMANGKTLADGLLQFRLANGGYYEPYYGADKGADYYTTGQSLLALTANYRMENGMTSLLDFSDVSFDDDIAETTTETKTTEETTSAESTTVMVTEPAKHTTIQSTPKTGDSRGIGFTVVIGLLTVVGAVFCIKNSKKD